MHSSHRKPDAGGRKAMPPAGDERVRPFDRPWLAAAVLAGIAAAAFAPAAGFEFVNLDDPIYVVQNPRVTSGLSAGGVGWAFTTFDSANWHPLTWLSLQLDASLWESKPLGFHLTNVLLHATNAAVLFLALRALSGGFWRSGAAALLFAVHPLRVESVAWVSERKDVLSVLFGLLTLWAYAGYARRPSAGRYAAVATCFVLSLLAKPMLVTLPLLLLVLDWWPLGRARVAKDWLRLIAEKLPLLALTAGSAVVTVQAQKASGAVIGLATYPPDVRAENAAYSYVWYLAKTVWPSDLAVFYPHPAVVYDRSGALAPAAAAGAAALLVASSVAAVALRRRAPYLLAGWLWYLGTLVPVIGLVQVGLQARADRYTYFPQVGILISACWAVGDLRPRRLWAAAAAAVVAAALALATYWQLQTWSDPLALWQHALRVSGRCPTVLVNLGETLERRQRMAEAFALYLDAVRLDPNSAQVRLDLGNALEKQGRLDEAARHFEEACRLEPKSPYGYTNLGNVLLRQNKPREAKARFETARGLAPDRGIVYRNLGRAEDALGNFDRAVECYRQSLGVEPNDAQARSNLGVDLVRLGKPEEGFALLQEAVRADPGSVEAHYRLGEALGRVGSVEAAAEEYERAVRLDGGRHPSLPKDVLERLAAAGRPDLARRLEERLRVPAGPVRP
jgi:tetratricopeptide (TPR) repeat protein